MMMEQNEKKLNVPISTYFKGCAEESDSRISNQRSHNRIYYSSNRYYMTIENIAHELNIKLRTNIPI